MNLDMFLKLSQNINFFICKVNIISITCLFGIFMMLKSIKIKSCIHLGTEHSSAHRLLVL